MEPLAAVWIPFFRIEAHRRGHRDCSGCPECGGVGSKSRAPLLALLGSRERVVALSREAVSQGLSVGMTGAQARAVETELVTATWDPSDDRRETEEIVSLLQKRVPHVEPAGAGLLYIGAGGLSFLYSSPERLCAVLEMELDRVGWRSRVGYAARKFSARCAAMYGRHSPTVLSPDLSESEFLAELPVSALPLTSEELEEMRFLGLESVGTFAALAPPRVERRWGERGVWLHRLARAEDGRPLTPREEPPEHFASMELDVHTDRSETILLAASRLLESILLKLSSEGKGCLGLEVRLLFEGDPVLGFPVNMSKAAASPGLVLELMKLRLDRETLSEPISRIEIEVTRSARTSPGQISLLDPRRVEEGTLDLLMARLETVLHKSGEAGRMASRDAWLPEKRESLVPLLCEEPDEASIPTDPENGVLLRDPKPFPLRFKRRGKILRVHVPGRSPRKVEKYRRLEVVRGGWWSDSWYREEGVLNLTSGERWRVSRKLPGGPWFFEGVYD